MTSAGGRGIGDDLTVVELATGSIASSLAGMILADNGARVLKIEPPWGDRHRESNPAGFLVWNRGKESVALDLKSATGKRTALDIMGSADVVLEAFGPGVAQRLGLGYDDLSPQNPGLVYCSVKGFGPTGPYASIKGYESMVAAKVGILTPGGYTGRRPARDGPISVGVPIASVGAAHQAVGGVLAALIAREENGRGQLVEASLLQGLNPYDYFGTMLWQVAPGPRESVTDEAGRTRARPPALLCAQDGRWIVQSSTLVHQLRSLIRVLGLDWLWDDPRFSTTPDLLPEHIPAFQDLFWEAFRSKPLDEWLPLLLAEPDIAFEVAASSEGTLDHPQMRHNHVVTVDDPIVGPVEQVGPIAAFDRTPSRIERSAPALDQHRALPVTGGRPAPPVASSERRAPLAGITIVEFGYFYAMPFAMTMAAALGARVIKVEDLRGDPVRWSYGTPEASGAKVMEGKESVAVDVSTAEGARIVRELVAKADVFAVGFRPGVAERLGVDYETLREVNPRLVYFWSTGYGHVGLFSHRPMYASTASAVAGCYHRQSARWLEPERSAGRDIAELKGIAGRLQPPVDGDANAALASFSALLLALYDQRRTGEGQLVATTMINGNAYAYADDVTRFEGKQPLPIMDEEQLGYHALQRVYPAQRGWIALEVPTQQHWQRLVDRPEFEALRVDRFATPAGRRGSDPELAAALAEVFCLRSAEEWERELSASGVGCAEVFEGTMSDFWCIDAVVRETEMVFEVEHPLFGSVLRHGLPVKMSASPGRVAPGCLLAQHTDLVLHELGYTAAEVDELVDREVVGRLQKEESMGGEHVHAV